MTYEHIRDLLGLILSLAQPTGVALAAYFAYRSSVASHKTLEVSRDVQIQTNGMTEKLVNLTRKSSFAEGKLEGEKRDT
jgi:hypothetical protein